MCQNVLAEKGFKSCCVGAICSFYPFAWKFSWNSPHSVYFLNWFYFFIRTKFYLKLIFFYPAYLSLSISILFIVFDRFILNGQFLYNSSIIFSWFAFSTSGRRGRFRWRIAKQSVCLLWYLIPHFGHVLNWFWSVSEICFNGSPGKLGRPWSRPSWCNRCWSRNSRRVNSTFVVQIGQLENNKLVITYKFWELLYV